MFVSIFSITFFFQSLDEPGSNDNTEEEPIICGRDLLGYLTLRLPNNACCLEVPFPYGSLGGLLEIIYEEQDYDGRIVLGLLFFFTHIPLCEMCVPLEGG